MNTLIPRAMIFYKYGFYIKIPMKVDLPLNKETESNEKNDQTVVGLLYNKFL